MNVKNISSAITEVIDKEFAPNMTSSEKAAMLGALSLGIVNIDKEVDVLLNSKTFAAANCWNEDKTELDVDVLEKTVSTILSSVYNGKIITKGYSMSIAGFGVTLFKGYVIDEKFMTNAFEILRKY